jgi:hypothetical protein
MGSVASANVFVPGSAFQAQLTNSPGNANQTVHIQPGTQGITTSLGSVNLTMSLQPTQTGGDWITFDYSNPSGALVESSNHPRSLEHI